MQTAGRVLSSNHRQQLVIISAILVYFFVCVVLAYMALGKPLCGVDDANIFMVYAKNIVAGKGIVYGAGQERVEGFSSPLYLAVLCLFFFWRDSPEPALMVMNFIFASAAIFLILNALKKTFRNLSATPLFYYFCAAAYLSVMLANPAYYSRLILSLMDNALYSLLIILGFSFLVNLQQKKNVVEKDCLHLFALVPFVVLSRPEGMVWAPVFIALFYIIGTAKIKDPITSSKKSFLPLLSFLGTAAALTVFRVVYFGYPLPNTFYAKVSLSFMNNFSEGLRYLTAFFTYYSLILTIIFFSFLALTGLFLFRRHEKLKHLEKEIQQIIPLAMITFVFILIGLILPVIEGGDYFNDFRFYQNIYPLLCVPFLYLVLIFHRSFTRAKIAAVAVLFNLFFFYANPAGWDIFYSHNQPGFIPKDHAFRTISEYTIALKCRENGEQLNLIFSGFLPTIGYGAAGGIAYAYNGIVYDMMGLNHTKMAHADAIKYGPRAHAAFNKEVFYEISPDILNPTSFRTDQPIALSQEKAYYCDPLSWDNIIFKNIFNDEKFKNSYSLAIVMNMKESRYKCYGFYSKSFISRLRINPSFKIEEVLKY